MVFPSPDLGSPHFFHMKTPVAAPPPEEHFAFRRHGAAPVAVGISQRKHLRAGLEIPQIRTLHFRDEETSVVAFATPKSITFGTGVPSSEVTRMFDGLMLR